jgi:hypothetical protein
MRAGLIFFFIGLSQIRAAVTPWSCTGGRAAFINELAYGSPISIGRAVEVISSSNKTNFDPQFIQVREGVVTENIIVKHLTNRQSPLPLLLFFRYLQSHRMELSRHRRLSLLASIIL